MISFTILWPDVISAISQGVNALGLCSMLNYQVLNLVPIPKCIKYMNQYLLVSIIG